MIGLLLNLILMGFTLGGLLKVYYLFPFFNENNIELIFSGDASADKCSKRGGVIINSASFPLSIKTSS